MEGDTDLWIGVKVTPGTFLTRMSHEDTRSFTGMRALFHRKIAAHTRRTVLCKLRHVIFKISDCQSLNYLLGTDGPVLQNQPGRSTSSSSASIDRSSGVPACPLPGLAPFDVLSLK
jgi:hypothetical protein